MYDKYKKTRIEWFNSIPSHWSVIPLKRMLMGLQDGTHGTYQNADSEHFLLSAKNIMEDGIHIGIGDRTISEEDYKEIIANGFPQKGDILLCCVGTIGRCCIFEEEEPIAFQRSVSFLRTNDRNHNKFILYLLNSQAAKIQYDLYAKTSAQSGLYMGDLCKLIFPCPPKAEQIAIAVYLDKKCEDINKSIDVEKKKIELLNELKQTIITKAVTKGLNHDIPMKDSGVAWIGKVPEHWEMRKIKNICKSEKYAIKTGPFGTQLKGQELQPDGDIRVYNQRNVIDDQFSQTQFYVSYNKAKELEAFYTKPLDLLVTSRGTIGRCSILPKDQPMGILHPCLIALRINTQICDINWAKIFINDSSCFATNIFLNSNATTIEVIYTDTLKNIVIPIPPVTEQEIIVAHIKEEISKIDAQISKANRRIELLNELKQSIITEAVTGKVKVC